MPDILPLLHQYFNPRSREGSDSFTIYGSRRACISIHAPAKGATADGCEKVCGVDFNPRSREGSDAQRHWCRVNHSYFNPRSREGSDLFESRFFLVSPNISIHAPAKGATVPREILLDRLQISIHAPAKGATGCRVNHHLAVILFQSTLPRRERPVGWEIACNCDDFNPRSREGSDIPRAALMYATAVFQSTLPRRERRTAPACILARMGFQSTLPRRERQ